MESVLKKGGRMKDVTVNETQAGDVPEDFRERPNPQAVQGLPSADDIKSVTATRKSKFIPSHGRLVVFDVSITRAGGKVENVEMVEGDWINFRALAGIETGA
jgi:hypothetical protein